MDSTPEILNELKRNGSETIKKIFLRHGAKEPFFGVKVEYLKKIQKRVKKNHALSLELYQTGISDAMYLAGLIADEKQISKAELNNWAHNAYWYMLSDFTVAWVAAESKYGYELALEWIESDKELVASAGWSTLASMAGIKPDSELNIKQLESLLERVEKTIHSMPGRIKYSMNQYVICLGVFVIPLAEKAAAAAARIGRLSIDMGDTSCKVPYAPEYMQKVIARGYIGKKRKQARC